MPRKSTHTLRSEIQKVMEFNLREAMAIQLFPLLNKIDTQHPTGRRDHNIILKKFTSRVIIRELAILAAESQNGEEVSAACLHSISAHSTRKLNKLAVGSLPILKNIAKNQYGWPILIIKNSPIFRKANSALYKQLHVGSGLHLALNPNKVMSKVTTARSVLMAMLPIMESLRRETELRKELKKMTRQHGKLANEFIAQIENTQNPDWELSRFNAYLFEKITNGEPSCYSMYIGKEHRTFPNDDSIKQFISICCKLPPLENSKLSIKEWMKGIKFALKTLYSGHPEQNPHLFKLGEFLSNKNGALRGTGTSNSNIREGIFRRLEATLASIAQNKG